MTHTHKHTLGSPLCTREGAWDSISLEAKLPANNGGDFFPVLSSEMNQLFKSLCFTRWLSCSQTLDPFHVEVINCSPQGLDAKQYRGFRCHFCVRFVVFLHFRLLPHISCVLKYIFNIIRIFMCLSTNLEPLWFIIIPMLSQKYFVWFYPWWFLKLCKFNSN